MVPAMPRCSPVCRGIVMSTNALVDWRRADWRPARGRGMEPCGGCRRAV